MAGNDTKRWLTANQAGALVGAAYGDNHMGALALLNALAAGLIATRCSRCSVKPEDAQFPFPPEDNIDLGLAFWTAVQDSESRENGDWRGSHFSAWMNVNSRRSLVSAFGVEMADEDIQALPIMREAAWGLSPSPPPPLAAIDPRVGPSATAQPVPRHAGGRPSHPYWEEAILTIAHRMHLGDFKPARQADVGRALAEWIVAQGYEEPGPTQLKQRAKVVFEMFKD